MASKVEIIFLNFLSPLFFGSDICWPSVGLISEADGRIKNTEDNSRTFIDSFSDFQII